MNPSVKVCASTTPKRLLRKKLEPFFGGIMDVYYILECGQRVLMGQTKFDGKDPCPGTFQIEIKNCRDVNLILSSKDKHRHVRVVYYAQTVYQLDIPTGAKKVPLKIDRR